MLNTNWDSKEQAKALDRGTKASYLISHIKKRLEEIRTLLLAGRNLFPLEIEDVVLLVIFTYIDLLGYLYKGKSLSKNAVQFLRDYLGRVDKRYEDVGGLLYDALRHGYVHLATPKRIQLRGGEIVDFQFGGAKERQDHLKKMTRRKEGKIEINHLSLGVDLLYEDLLSAIDKYAEDIRHNQVLSDIFWKAFETRRRPQKAKEEVLLSKPYIQDSDFAFVRKQISNL